MRKRAATALNRALTKLDKARAEWRCFEEEYRPCYTQWMALTFGVLLTEVRENDRVIHEQQNLINEVEMEMMWGRQRNPRKAYAAVMKRRENPVAEDDFARAAEAGQGNGCDHDDHGARDEADKNWDPFKELDADPSEEARHAMFDDFLESFFGINPEHLGETEYNRMFDQFEANTFGRGQQEGRARMHQATNSVAGRDAARIKEIYRTLVRRLHPDVQADEDKNVSAIWHEVQDAYETSNLERLESLLALVEIQNGTIGRDTSVSQLEGALAGIKHGLRAIQRSIREAKHDPAWRFSRSENRMALEKSVRRELQQNISQQRWMISDLKRTLDDWSRPLEPPVKKTKKQPVPVINSKTESPVMAFDSRTPTQTEFFGF